MLSWYCGRCYNFIKLKLSAEVPTQVLNIILIIAISGIMLRIVTLCSTLDVHNIVNIRYRVLSIL